MRLIEISAEPAILLLRPSPHRGQERATQNRAQPGQSCPCRTRGDQQHSLGFLDAECARLRAERERRHAQQPDGLVTADVLDGKVL